jgi:hypothetical protein
VAADADYRIYGRGFNGQGSGRNGADSAARSETNAKHFAAADEVRWEDLETRLAKIYLTYCA